MRPPTEYCCQLDQEPQRGYFPGIGNILVANDAFGNAFGLFNGCMILVVEQIAGKQSTIEFKRHVCCRDVLICGPNVMQQAS